MRYYKIVVGGRTFESFTGGKNIPGALNVELDIPVYAYAAPAGAGWVQISGIPLKDVSQASDFNGKPIQIYGGMQRGLPLANPAQAGLLVDGVVFQAFGNWIGTSQTLDFVIQPSTGTFEDPKNLTLDWKKNTPLSGAIQNTMSTAFPDYTLDINISDKLVLPTDEPGFYGTLGQFATYIKQTSAIILGGDYRGVDIVITEKTIRVYDGTTQTSPTMIAFQDMIGQPTWINPGTVQTKFVMRADLVVGDFIKFPKGTLVTNPGAAPTIGDFNPKISFQGTFQISQERHVGNFRQPDAASWVSVVDAFPSRAAA